VFYQSIDQSINRDKFLDRLLQDVDGGAEQ